MATACSLKTRSHNTNAASAPQVVMINGEECERPAAQSVRFYLGSDVSDQKHETTRVKSTGYGAPPKKYYPQYQRDLMAMRASKIDAYRALAETINGLHIWGGTTLGNMTVQDDHYRVFLNSYVRGANVESVKKRDDGNYETVVSTVIDQNFLSYALSNRLTQNAGCDTTVSAFGANNGLAPVVYSDGMAPSSFYYSE
ncbi:MAG: hypothetical protein GXP19_00760 [Gammaproteobacteria bacterium]|nr:hypothetical protein [Gammaproteobacteria bacterium]